MPWTGFEHVPHAPSQDSALAKSRDYKERQVDRKKRKRIRR